jgi:hypothetical protein
MSSGIKGSQQRQLLLGAMVTAKPYTLSASETKSLFTIAGGNVAITALWGVVTTVMTVANTVKLSANPTTGTSGDLVTATDLGTTDTPAGDLLGISGVVGDSIIRSVGFAEIGFKQGYLAVAAGTVDITTSGTSMDGVIAWYLTYVPLDTGASVVAV